MSDPLFARRLFPGEWTKFLQFFRSSFDRIVARQDRRLTAPQDFESARIKDRVYDRLSRIEVMEGVLPTRREKSGTLSDVASSLDKGDVQGAQQRTVEYLRQLPSDVGNEPATALLSGNPGLQEQVGAFARAGFGFFHATRNLWDLDPAERVSRGGNGAITRVLLARERILLETPRVVVRFAEGKVADLKRYGLFQIGGDGLPPNTIRASVLHGQALERALDIMQDPAVVYAEPDFIECIGQRYTPNDSEFVNQWHHKNIQSERAWDYSKGDNVSVAIIDNGFHMHRDLTPGGLSGWFRPTPDLVDADFVAGTTNMSGGDHGTACAGMLAARSETGAGGCGVAFQSGLNLIACVPDQVGTQTTLARAIGYAARPSLEPAAQPASMGADVISCSLGPNSAIWTIQQVLSDALDFAATEGRNGKGCAIFWACTNGNFPIGSDEICSHRHVMAVGRSGKNDEDDGCGWGPQLEFLAPGVQVWLPAGDTSYKAVTGASFAAPCAAGAAALALALAPGLHAAELRQLMRDACDKTGSLPYIHGRNARFGHGRVNTQNAVNAARQRRE